MRRLALVCLSAMLVAGCGSGTGNPPFADDGDDRVRQQAREALDRWDRAVAEAGGRQGFVPVGEVSRQVGDWELPTGENNKLTLASGVLELSGVDGSQALPTSQVVWADGTTRTLRTVTVAEAVANIRAAGPGPQGCDGCTPLRIISAQPVAVDIDTTRGPTTAPAWEFTLEGTAVKVVHVAVARSEGVDVTPPSWDPYNAPGGIRIERARVEPGGQRLTVTFTGSPGPASQPCGADYTGEAMESDTAVVAIITAHPSVLTGQIVKFSRLSDRSAGSSA